MPRKTPNYSQDRSQRQRAQQAKAQKKADLLAEKSARRKEARGDIEPKPDADTPE